MQEKPIAEAMQGIYAIVNVVTSRRYIGSSTDIDRRWMTHVCDLRKGRCVNQRLQRAWRKYGPAAFRLEIVEEVLAFEQLIERERAHVMTTAGCYNIVVPGRGMHGLKHSPEAIEKIRAAAKARPPLSAEVRAGIAAKWRGRKWTPEQRAHLSLVRQGQGAGRKLFPEHIEAIRRSRLGHQQSAVTIAKRKATFAAHPGLNISAESNAKRSAALMGHPVSEETRAKQRAAWARRRANAMSATDRRAG